MISETKTQSDDVPTVEKKKGAPKRNYNKKEPKTVETEAVISKPKAKPRPRPTREKKQPVETQQNDDDEETNYKKLVNLIETNPSVAEEFQNIIKKHLK